MLIKTGIIPGRFQPLTKAHKQIIDIAVKENDIVYVMIVRGKNAKIEKNPYSFEEQKKFFNALYDNINIIQIPTGDVFKPIKEQNLSGEHFTIYHGIDRKGEFETFKRNFTNAGFLLNIKTLDLDRENVSATSARNAIKENDQKELKRLLPKEIIKLV